MLCIHFNTELYVTSEKILHDYEGSSREIQYHTHSMLRLVSLRQLHYNMICTYVTCDQMMTNSQLNYHMA